MRSHLDSQFKIQGYPYGASISSADPKAAPHLPESEASDRAGFGMGTIFVVLFLGGVLLFLRIARVPQLIFNRK